MPAAEAAEAVAADVAGAAQNYLMGGGIVVRHFNSESRAGQLRATRLAPVADAPPTKCVERWLLGLHLRLGAKVCCAEYEPERSVNGRLWKTGAGQKVSVVTKMYLQRHQKRSPAAAGLAPPEIQSQGPAGPRRHGRCVHEATRSGRG
jgi:hypothetical protein